MLPDVVESLSEEGDGGLAALPLGLAVGQLLLQRRRVLPGQIPRGAQLRLDPFARHGESFVQRRRDCGRSWEASRIRIVHFW